MHRVGADDGLFALLGPSLVPFGPPILGEAPWDRSPFTAMPAKCPRAAIARTCTARGLVRPPAHELGAMAETVARNVVVAHLHHQFWSQRLPFRRPCRAPPARPPGALPVKPGGAISFSRRIVSSGFSWSAMAEVKPT